MVTTEAGVWKKCGDTDYPNMCEKNKNTGNKRYQGLQRSQREF